MASIAALSIASPIAAQDVASDGREIDYGVMYVEPLFEYPVAPEELTDFTQKCDWLAENFWTGFDTKSKGAVDQVKLNHAFKTYATACQYASKDKVNAALDKLMKGIQKNPSLLVQFAKAAEESIYGPRAEVWIDELYMKVLQSTLASKKFPKSRRARYEEQLKQLQNTTVGATPAAFDFKRANGDAARYFPMATPTVIFFGDPSCDDCRMARLRMEANVAFSKAVADGKLNLLYIIPDPEPGWETEVASYPRTWTIGSSDSVSEIYDLRDTPDVYLIGSDGKIIGKHMAPMEAVRRAVELVK